MVLHYAVICGMKRISVTVPNDLAEKLEAFAERNNLSVSAATRWILSDCFSEDSTLKWALAFYQKASVHPGVDCTT